LNTIHQKQFLPVLPIIPANTAPRPESIDQKPAQNAGSVSPHSFFFSPFPVEIANILHRLPERPAAHDFFNSTR
jgi:hypothetical protein